MKTLRQIRNEIAINHGSPNWDDYVVFMLRQITTHQLVTRVIDEAMESYHAQFSNVTDEDIEKWAEVISDSRLNGHDTSALIRGAKAMREGKIPTKK